MAIESKPKARFFSTRNLFIISAGLIVIFIGVAVGLWYWTTSPQYTIRQIRSAIDSHNWEQFQKHVDIDSLSASAANQIIDYSLNNSCREKSGDFVPGLLNVTSSALAQIMRNQLHSYVETGSLEKISGSTAENSSTFNVELLFRKLSGGNTAEINKIEYVKTDGQQASVGIKIYYPKLKADTIIELNLKNYGGEWKLTGVSKLGEFLSRLSKLEITKLDKLNRPVAEKVTGLLLVSTVSTAKIFGDASGNYEALSFRFNLKNSGKQTIKQLDGEVLVFDRNTGQLIMDWSVKSGEITLAPGLTDTLSWTRSLSKKLPGDLALINVPYGDLITKFKAERVVFEDGSKLEAATTLP